VVSADFSQVAFQAVGVGATISHPLPRRVEMQRARQSVMPYLLAQDATALIAFMKQAFQGEERLRVGAADGSVQHAEVAIGDSVIELADGRDPWPARPAAIHLYVEDADAVHARAVAAGAETLVPPTDMPYGDREADVRDPTGNHWYIGTWRGSGPLPHGMRSVTPILHVAGTEKLFDFVRQALAAEALELDRGPDGHLVHALVRLGGSVLELSEPGGFVPPMPASIHYLVESVDGAYTRALAAGATALGEPSNRPYGERAAEVADPFGNNWFLGAPLS
jgi:uncharacterized glyoxalase superfamily protein PhnB